MKLGKIFFVIITFSFLVSVGFTQVCVKKESPVLLDGKFDVKKVERQLENRLDGDVVVVDYGKNLISVVNQFIQLKVIKYLGFHGRGKLSYRYIDFHLLKNSRHCFFSCRVRDREINREEELKIGKFSNIILSNCLGFEELEVKEESGKKVKGVDISEFTKDRKKKIDISYAYIMADSCNSEDKE